MVDLGKVGGKPVWLNPALPLQRDQVICGVCNDKKKPMKLLLQLNASASDSDGDQNECRVFYVFACESLQCLNTDATKS